MSVVPHDPSAGCAALPVWQALIDSLPDAAWLACSATRRVLGVNAKAAQLLGEPAQALLGRDAAALAATPEDAAWWAEAAGGDAAPLWSEVALPVWPGQAEAGPGPGHWERRLTCLVDPAGGPSAVLLLLRDLTREQREAQAREVLVAELRATLEATADGILVTDLHGRIRAFNRRFANLWGMPESVLHAGDDSAVHAWMRGQVVDAAQYSRRLDDLLSAPEGLDGDEQVCDRLTLLSGDMLERRLQPQLARGTPIGHVYSFRPVLPAAAHAGPWRRLGDDRAGSGEDSVTGLPDRPRLLRHIDESLDRVRRTGGALSVLCIDLDLASSGDFMESMPGGFNGQAHAPAPGSDRILRDVAQAVRGCVRQPDIVARIAGLRLAVLVHHLGEQGAETLARRILGTASRRVVSDALPGEVTMSIGAALYPEGGTTAFELLAHAEQACVRAGSAQGPRLVGGTAEGPSRRQNAGLSQPLNHDTADRMAQRAQGGSDALSHPFPDGDAGLPSRDRFRFYRPADNPDHARDQRMEAALRDALGSDDLCLAFQPVVDLAGARILGAEALLRWRGTEWGDLPPVRFLDVARAAGLLPAVDRLALRGAIEQAATWRAQGCAIAVSVNQSAQEVLQPGFVQRVTKRLQACDLPAGLLEIEITEEVLLSDPQTARAVMADLQRLGVGWTLDDFGVGLSALGHLRELPLRSVKLARSLLRDVPHVASRTQVLSALLAVTESLGVRTVAKGVENEAQRAWLQSLGCRLGQGFLFASAQPPLRLAHRLRQAA